MSPIPNVARADETIAELLAREPRAVRILLGHGMHCVGCVIAPFETLAEVCAIYGLPLEQLLENCAVPTGRRLGGHREHDSNISLESQSYRRRPSHPFRRSGLE
jgi:hybrid cluster-associated redox disulfide protein